MNEYIVIEAENEEGAAETALEWLRYWVADFEVDNDPD
jgi:hypothetical protein